MYRPRQHEIGDQGLRIFAAALPRAWVYREQPGSDYGIDAEIEVFANHAKASAVISEETARLVRFNAHEDPHECVARVVAETARKLRRVTRRGPRDLRAFSILVTHASRFLDASYIDFGLFLTGRAGPPGRPRGLTSDTIRRRRLTDARLLREYRHCADALVALERAGGQRMVPMAAARVIQSFTPVWLRMMFEGQRGTAAAYRSELRELAEAAATIGGRLGDTDSVALVVSLTVCLGDPEDPRDRAEALEWAERALAGCGLSEADQGAVIAHIRSVEEAKDEQLQRKQPDEDDFIAEAQIYREMAVAHGIDVDGGTDDAAELVRIGLADLNPERALRHCVHAMVGEGPSNPIADALQMPTAAVKSVFCGLHRHAVGGVPLDDIAREFQRAYCDGCPDRSPHPPAWKWSRAWHREREEELRSQS